MKLDVFQTELQQYVRLMADAEGQEQSLSTAFTRTLLEELVQAGEVLDPKVAEAFFESRKMITSATDWDEERGVMTFFASSYSATETTLSMTKAELAPLLAGAERFAAACANGLFREVEESLDVFDTAQFVLDSWKNIRLLRFVILTNRKLNTAIPASGELDGIPTRYDVWDLERTERLMNSGKTSEPLDIETKHFGHEGIGGLGPFRGHDEYEVYMTVIPGDFLADLYEEHGSKLLELNVRSFLQARGKTNQGIQATIKNEPHRFLAYNNGLSMTASGVETSVDSGGAQIITRLRGLQIVNGGQTTASLFHAAKRSNLDISEVMVQAKLTVVDDDVRAELAPLISRFANTQNVIRMADFSANDPFHVEIEKLSRSIWAPAQSGTHEMTRWFYERSRGQYADAVGRERTPAQKKLFSNTHPRKQLFTKTDVAKYEHAWSQFPFLVALGAEKNFTEYSQRLSESKTTASADGTFFQHLVAKAIMWKQTESLVNGLKLGGYRSAVVAYTISTISNRTSMRVDLDSIWRAQDVPEAWKLAVTQVAPLIHSALVATAGTRNVLEWAKKKECWTAIQEVPWTAPRDLLSNLAPLASRSLVAASAGTSSLPASEEELAGRTLIEALGSDAWFMIAVWAKETSNLQSWQRGLSASIGQYLAQDRILSAKQVIQGVKIAEEAQRLGFRMERPS